MRPLQVRATARARPEDGEAGQPDPSQRGRAGAEQKQRRGERPDLEANVAVSRHHSQLSATGA